ELLVLGKFTVDFDEIAILQCTTGLVVGMIIPNPQHHSIARIGNADFAVRFAFACRSGCCALDLRMDAGRQKPVLRASANFANGEELRRHQDQVSAAQAAFAIIVTAAPCHPERKSRDPEEVTLKLPQQDPSTFARDDGARARNLNARRRVIAASDCAKTLPFAADNQDIGRSISRLGLAPLRGSAIDTAKDFVALRRAPCSRREWPALQPPR